MAIHIANLPLDYQLGAQAVRSNPPWIDPMNILPLDRQVAVIAGLCEGLSIRSTERLTGVHRDTIMRLGMRVGFGCDGIHNRLMQNLRPLIIELDELWAFVGKKQRRTTDDDVHQKGDQYTFLALAGMDKAIISYQTGKRDGITTEMFITDLKNRVLGSPVISTDGFAPYRELVVSAFAPRLHYGQVVKQFQAVPGNDAAHRYSPGQVVNVRYEAVYGNPRRISTSHVERQNLSVRMSSRRFTRLTNGFSKKLVNHAAAVSLYVAHHNFCRVHETIRTTPAVSLGVTDHVWSVAELVQAALQTDEMPPPVQGRIAGPFRVFDGGSA